MMTTTMTDRYVWAVTRLLPERQRAEIDLELRSSIGDMIEARGEGEGDEAAVLLELGDPSRLAAGYAERPHHLIGPEDFPEYLRMLKLVAAVAIPGMAFLTSLGAVIDDEATGGDLVGVILSTVFTTAVHVGFWVTLFYAVRARVQHEPWSLESLPDVPQDGRVARSDTVFELILVLAAIGAILWDRTSPHSDGEGDGVPFLHPSLWDGWIFVVIGLLVAGGVVALLAYRAGRWTPPLVAANVGANAVLLAVVGWLAFDDRVVNPRFLEVLANRAEWPEVPEANPWIIVLLVGAVLVWDSAETVVRARRHAGRVGGQASDPQGTDPLVAADG
jgi:hypothetical protein